MKTTHLLLIALTITGIGCADKDKKTNKESSIKMDEEAQEVQRNPDKDVYWGDTHLHTSNSFDVYLFGTPNATLETAYRFARGEEVVSPTTGEKWKLSTPLDFMVVADHAEMVGSIPRLYQGDTTFINTKSGKALLEVGGSQSMDELADAYGLVVEAGSGVDNDYGLTGKDLYVDMHGGEKRRNTWTENCETADKYNEPGKFTALIGWEWSSNTDGANLHRVLFTPTDSEGASQFIPYSSLESDDPEKLWEWLDTTSESTGLDFVAIPHNPNLSMGKMFPLKTNSGKDIDAGYATLRMKWEPAVEVTQIKGDSETHPNLSPTDEFADFETFSFVLIPGAPPADEDEGDYVRSGLQRGLEFKNKVGVNPYKVGMIGSTDSHTGISAVEENNFAGKGQHDATPEQRPHPTSIGTSKGWDMGANGYVAAWAESNTRDDIFAAFKRKEVYASSGPRIALRVYGGYEYTDADANAQNMPEIGYEKGVPMGGDLTASGNQSPRLMVKATKDPNDANLDRIQVIKGWLNTDWNAEEKIYDVALSDGRTDGSVAVGNTVDLTTGEYTNTIGDTELTTVWTDPDFDPAQEAFYYVRVLQIPTPRYSLLNCIEMGIDPKSTGRPLTIQERVYSSPIWYSPK